MAAQDKRGSTVFVGEDPSVSAPLKIHEKPIEDVIAEFQIKVKFFSSMAAWLVYLSRTCRQDAFWTFSGDSGSPRGRGRRKIPTLLFAGLIV